MQQIHQRTARIVAACLGALGLLAAGAGAEDVMPVYGAVVRGPSVPLSYANGASPYSGIGRYEGLARCTAFFVDTAASFSSVSGQQAQAPAYVLTEGRCAARLDADDVLVDHAGQGRVLFNYFADSGVRQVTAQVARTAYATMRGRNLALLELAVTYEALVDQLVRPLPLAPSALATVGEPVAVVGAPLTGENGEDFLRLAFCRIDGVAAVVVEHGWRWFDSPFNQCRDMRVGSSGSPVLSILSRAVVGLIGTSTSGAERVTECALGHPCERTDAGTRSRKNTNYITHVAGITSCFDRGGRFRADEPGCPLDAASPRPAVSSQAALNPGGDRPRGRTDSLALPRDLP